MPKVQSSANRKHAKHVSEFLNELLRSDIKIVYSSVSGKSTAIEQRCQITQSVQTNKHKENEDRIQIFEQKFFSSTSSSIPNTFNSDLCQTFINADIPLVKLQDSSLNPFLEKYTNQLIPDENTLNENYIQPIYKETLLCIRNLIDDGPKWVSIIDETTDVNGRFITNIIIGKFINCKSKPFMLNIMND